MPHIIVKLYKGKSEEQKTKLTEEIANCFYRTLQSNEKSISIAIEDVEPSDWPESVYRPDILDKEHMLYKKPGYQTHPVKPDRSGAGYKGSAR